MQWKAFSRWLAIGLLAAGVVAAGLYYYSAYPQNNGYRFVIQRKALPGLVGLSGLTFQAQRGTLFAVTDHPSNIVELTTQGDILRIIKVANGDDLESIAWLGGNRYAISEEKRRRVSLVELDDTQPELDLARFPSITEERFYQKRNSGFEGMMWIPETQTLVLAQEKKPFYFPTIAGLPTLSQRTNLIFSLSPLASFYWHLLVRDISGLSWHRTDGSTLVLSKRPKKITCINAQGKLSFIHLNGGKHGLLAAIPQPEGIASDEQGNIYVVSEPNLFYRLDGVNPTGVTQQRR